MIPLIVVVDPHYVGHESIRDEVGYDYEVTAAIGFSEAQQRIADFDTPLVVLPETLEPETGRIVLDRLKAAGHRFVGLLLVDDAAGLPRFSPDSGITHVAFRPLRQGEFRRHVDAAAATREALLVARAEAGLLGSALSVAAARLRQLADLPSDHAPALARRALHHLTLASRPLEPAWLDPAELLRDATDSAIATHADRNVRIFASFPDTPIGARSPRLFGDARALREALIAIADNALRHAARPEVQLTLGCEACRHGDQHGWLITIEDDGGGQPPSALEAPTTGFGLTLATHIIKRHAGHLETSGSATGWRVQVWLPEALR